MPSTNQKLAMASQAIVLTVGELVHQSYLKQRDPIPDSDLDDCQPVTLTIQTTLGVLRKLDIAAGWLPNWPRPLTTRLATRTPVADRVPKPNPEDD